MNEIERLIEAKKWAKARALILEELVSAPTDHWHWMMLSLTYYEGRRYENSLTCAKRAVELQPDYPIALWHYAPALFMPRPAASALAIWTLLLHKGPDVGAYG